MKVEKRKKKRMNERKEKLGRKETKERGKRKQKLRNDQMNGGEKSSLSSFK